MMEPFGEKHIPDALGRTLWMRGTVERYKDRFKEIWPRFKPVWMIRRINNNKQTHPYHQRRVVFQSGVLWLLSDPLEENRQRWSLKFNGS